MHQLDLALVDFPRSDPITRDFSLTNPTFHSDACSEKRYVRTRIASLVNVINDGIVRAIRDVRERVFPDYRDCRHYHISASFRRLPWPEYAARRGNVAFVFGRSAHSASSFLNYTVERNRRARARARRHILFYGAGGG